MLQASNGGGLDGGAFLAERQPKASHRTFSAAWSQTWKPLRRPSRRSELEAQFGTLFLWASVICFTSAGGYVAYTGLTNMEQLQRGGKSKAPPQTAFEAKKNPETKAKK
jgi:hypothetical protein